MIVELLHTIPLIQWEALPPLSSVGVLPSVQALDGTDLGKSIVPPTLYRPFRSLVRLRRARSSGALIITVYSIL